MRTAMRLGTVSLLVLGGCRLPADAHQPQSAQWEQLGRLALARRLQRVDDGLGALLLSDRDATVERVQAPFLERGAVYFVSAWSGWHSVKLFVGCADELTLDLSSPENFGRFTASAGLKLDSRSRQVAYAALFLEATRRTSLRPFVVLHSVDQLRTRAEARPEDKQRLSRIREVYRGAVAPCTEDGSPATVIVHAVDGNDLVRLRCVLSSTGLLEVSTVQILVRSLPVPYAYR